MKKPRSSTFTLSSLLTQALVGCAYAGAAVVSSQALAASAVEQAARPPRILKFSGVPLTQATALRKKFPFVFEREVSLAEVDEITRYLMQSGSYSNIEVVERDSAEGGRELVLLASVLRRIQDIKIEGNYAMSTNDIQRTFGVTTGQPFERKNLLAAAEELRRAYERIGYHNSKVEIEFDLPSDSEVRVVTAITEGKPVKVSEVSIETPNTELAIRLARMGRSLKNRILTDDELLDFQKSAGEYLRENRYLTARITEPTITYNADRTLAKLSYGIENPFRFEFRLEGNQHFSEGSIISDLESEKLAGATTSPAPDMAERIRRKYQAVGFANVEVQFSEDISDTLHRQLIRFNITENPRVRIRKIEVIGNVSRPEAYYTKFITSSSSDLIGEGFYNRRDIEDGAKRLVTELQNQGFLRAKIQSQRADYAKDKASVIISLNIDEGPLTQVRQIRFEGADSFARQELLELLKIKTGAALSLRDLEESLQVLKEFYRNEGFLEMKVLNENERNQIVTYNDTNTQATIEFKIQEGPRVIVGSVSLKGNTFTKDYVILRELAFTTGDVLTPERVNDSISHLQSLGLFSRVTIRTLEEGTSTAERTVIIEIEETDPGSFRLGLGVNNENQLTIRGYLAVGYRNIGGAGRGVVFRVDPQYSTDPRISYVENRITLSYIEPYIFGDRNRGRVNVVRDQSFFEFAEGDATIQETNSVGLLLERDLTRKIKLTYTAYNFANQLQFNRRTRDFIKTQNIAKTGALVEYDTRDNAFYPSRGLYSFVNLEYADPFLGSSADSTQTINFVKTNASVTTYKPLFGTNDYVWASSVRGGYLANVSRAANSGVPSQEAFFLGGRSTIRGFDAVETERIPNKIDLGVASLSDFRVTTDSYFYLLKTEFRFPLYRNFALGPLGGVVFYDGGSVIVSQPDVRQSDPYRDSAGLGLRVATPVGPLNLEFGWKLDRRSIDSTRLESVGAFHFSIGEL